MSSTVIVIQRLIVKFALGKQVPAANLKGRQVVKAMTGNSYFPNASTAVSAASAGLDQLQTLVASKAGSPAIRRQLSVCIGLFDVLKGIVQVAADNDPVDAATIIKSASMGIRKGRVTAATPDIGATWGTVSGMALLVAKAYGRASYEWEMSTDGTNWSVLPTTLKSHTTVTGLTPGQKYWFRVKVTTKNGERDWVQTGNFLMMK